MAEGDDTGNGNIHSITQKVVHFGSPPGTIYGDKHKEEPNERTPQESELV